MRPRLTLAVSLMGVALRVDPADLRALACPVGLLITIGMAAMWALSSGVAALALGLSVLPALVLGAAVTPTDPLVASSIITGHFARAKLPQRLRDALSLESGANDGPAYPFVLLPVLLMAHPPGGAVADWIVRGVLTGILLAVAIGAATGWALARIPR